MLILTLRTDNPQAELGLFDGTKQLEYISWEAHRELSDTIHSKIRELLKSADKNWSDIQGIACFQGPGSFTGLRIGLSVGNALAGSLNIPIVAFTGVNWKQLSIEALLAGSNQQIVLPEYGAEPHITKPKK